MDSGFLGFILFFSPFERARRRHLHQRRAWTHRFRAPAWAVKLLANEVMIYDTEAGRTAGLSVLAFLGFPFSEEGYWEGGRRTTRTIEKGIRRKYMIVIIRLISFLLSKPYIIPFPYAHSQVESPQITVASGRV